MLVSPAGRWTLVNALRANVALPMVVMPGDGDAREVVASESLNSQGRESCREAHAGQLVEEEGALPDRGDAARDGDAGQ